MIQCACGSDFRRDALEEWDDGRAFLRYHCRRCGFGLGIETDTQRAGVFFDRPAWTDEAQHRLDRLPPYVEPLVRQEVEDYAIHKSLMLISTDLMAEARHQGTVSWHPDAKSRLSRIPAPVRAMARVELERAAQDRGLSAVTVALMEEIKTRYFGMGRPPSPGFHADKR